MVDTLELDYETANEIDLTEYGLDRYRSHYSARALMAAYAINGGTFKHWQRHLRPKPPAELVEALLDPEVEKWAFNAQFERVITRDVLKIDTPIKGWRCSMVLAGLQGFNGGLEVVGERIGLPLDQQKIKGGDRLIQTFSMPQRMTKAQPNRWRDWETDPELWEELCEYNIQDGYAEREQRRRLISYPCPEEEWELYEIDQEINDRGLPLDMVFVNNAIRMSRLRKAELTDMMRAICGLANPGSVQQLLPWLQDNGYWFNDLNKYTVAKVLAVDAHRGSSITDECREILKLRKWQASLSTAKYDAMLKRVGEDGWLRYCYQMAGAGRTARWAGRGVQTQNLRVTPDSLEDEWVLDEANRIIHDGDYEELKIFMDEPMEALTGCVRSSFRAPEGQEFVVADLKSIESAMVAVETDCERLLGVLAHPTDNDTYKDFGTEFYGIPYSEVTRKQRKFCKPPALGCAYRLGGGELVAGKRTGLWGYAENMGVDMERDDSHRAVRVFRTIYPEIPNYWPMLEGAIETCLDTKKDTWARMIRFEYRKPYLLAWLPTGRPIFYFLPLMKNVKVHTGRMIERRSRGPEIDGVPKGEMVEVEETYERRSFTYMGQNQVTRKWERIHSHGGRTIEQVTQANSREVLKYGIINAHRAGWMLCGHSHDEAIGLRNKGSNEYTLEGLKDCLTAPIAAYPGLPLGAAGYVGDYYKKD